MPKKKPLYNWDPFVDGVTQSGLNAFLQCRELATLKLKEGLAPAGTRPALEYGSFVHDVLEKVYAGGFLDDQEQVAGVIKAVEAKRAPKVVGVDAYGHMVGMAEAVLMEYFAWYAKEDSKKKWVDLEQVFDVPYELPGVERPIRLRGRFDGVFRIGKRLWLLETKTMSQINDDALIDGLSFNLQNLFYLRALEIKMGEKPAGVLYNILRKPGLRQKQNELSPAFAERCQEDISTRPEHYFLRYEIVITPAERARWEGEFEMLLQEFIEWAGDGVNYRSSCACRQAWGSCDFLPVCSRNDRSNFATKAECFPELNEGEDA